MKIALCISGQPRFVENAFPNIYNNIIQPNNPDVFIHCWYDENLIGQNFVNPALYSANNWDYSSDKSKYSDNLDKLILDLYKPKKYIFENQKSIKDDTLRLEEILNSHARVYTREYFVEMLYSSWYSILKSNMLKEEYRLENNIMYDYVIRMRFDATFNMPVVCSEYDPNFLHTDRRPDFPIPRMIEDWFGFGSNKIMNIYSSAFNYMQYAVEESNKYDRIFCSETLVYEMMKVFNIRHVAIQNLRHQPIKRI